MASNSRNVGTKNTYAKFSVEWDVCLLETVLEHNPFTARHGSRISMWHIVAEKLGTQLETKEFSWHTCRDRIDALFKLYEKDERGRLYKKGDDPALNSRKEELLTQLIQYRRLPKSFSAQDTASASPPGTPPRRNGKRQREEVNGFRTAVVELLEKKIEADAAFRSQTIALKEEELELQRKLLEILRRA